MAAAAAVSALTRTKPRIAVLFCRRDESTGRWWLRFVGATNEEHTAAMRQFAALPARSRSWAVYPANQWPAWLLSEDSMSWAAHWNPSIATAQRRAIMQRGGGIVIDERVVEADATAPKPKRAYKRKQIAAPTEELAEDTPEAEEGSPPAPKKRGRKSKTTLLAEEDAFLREAAEALAGIKEIEAEDADAADR